MVEVYIPKNPDPGTLGLIFQTSHPQVIGLDRCNPLLDTPGFLGYGECRQLYHKYASYGYETNRNSFITTYLSGFLPPPQRLIYPCKILASRNNTSSKRVTFFYKSLDVKKKNHFNVIFWGKTPSSTKGWMFPSESHHLAHFGRFLLVRKIGSAENNQVSVNKCVQVTGVAEESVSVVLVIDCIAIWGFKEPIEQNR